MRKLQFQVLYRQFLFRIVDPELLSGHAQGDANTLLGQFAALLITVSLAFTLAALAIGGARMTPFVRLLVNLGYSHLLISTTMLAVGLFAVLSWDSTFPDRRDVFVLAPLPVRSSTLFLAKTAASVTVFGLVIALLNSLCGLFWPFAMGNGIRSFAAYWTVVFASGTFVYCSVLCVQGLAAHLLPRRWFLRLSAFLQIGVFCLFVSVYFLQPPFASISEILDPKNQRWFPWLPSYWFLGALQQCNGTQQAILAPLARRAWMGLAIAVGGSAVTFLLSWFRTLRRIAEQADIVPGVRGVPLPRFGKSWQTAIVQFSIRSFLRSRQHRLILAFYLGIGFALVIFLMKSPEARGQMLAASSLVNGPVLASTIVMLGFWMLGIRVLFSRPLDIGANWIFQITPAPLVSEWLAANRRSLFVLALGPWLTIAAAFLFSFWPWRPAAGHLIVLGFLGVILADLCLYEFRKIPFTCSYLPGRSNIHVSFILCIVFIVEIIYAGAQLEVTALGNGVRYAYLVSTLCLAALLARWRASPSKWEARNVEFEEVPPWSVISLGLPRDGGVKE
jgi:hypothetical protein